MNPKGILLIDFGQLLMGFNIPALKQFKRVSYFKQVQSFFE